MQIHLTELEHQKNALKAIMDNFPPLAADQSGSPYYANPLLEYSRDHNHFIDIKMETGTGKTYVYARAMYELHKRLGLYKFIIIVPSLAIKEGTKNFINSAYARQHFAKYYPNVRLELHTINKGDFDGKKGKRKTFPAALSSFCESTKNIKNTIQCLLISDKGFLDRADSALFKNDYDQTLFGGYSCPADGLKSTLPVLIIDEPHRIKKDGSSYKNIIEKLNPQMIMRFGATFPEIQQGKGIKDYYQKEPQFDLCAVDAFNQDLVKGVAVQYPALPENEASERYRVKKAGKSELILTKDNREYAISIGAALPGFDGNIKYEGEQKLSNELELSEGMELVKGVFSNNYQEILIRQAINAHFETEISNFQRHGGKEKVKTITLFFIDSIKGYRDKNGWLKQTFENLLKAKLDELLEKYKSGEYHDYLLATKNNIAAAHGGYFAQDWNQPDDSAAAEELQDILHKERTLTFKKDDGSWNIRRFFFSKWTLREGWDNPNVFTICKLRSSGSETSKIQEAGRGLRLPVDEHGNRLADEEWKLNFIIGYDEKEFAQKLIGEINADAKIILDTHKITDEMIRTICDARNIDKNGLLEKLDNDGIINRSNEFKPGGFEKLVAEYPELSKVKQGKITSPGLKQKKIKLRTENWQKIKDFWQQVSKRYMLCFERLNEGDIESLFGEVLDIDGIFDDNRNISITVNATAQGQEGSVILTQQTITIDNPGKIGALPYNDFVKRISKRTSVPPQTVHKKLWQKLMEFAKKGLSKEAINAKINHNTLEKIIAAWHEKFAETFAEKYHYDPLNFTADTSIIKDGSFLQELPYGLIGTNTAADIVSDNRNLYEVPLAYDSEIPEHEILRIAPPQQIIVFGKIPRRAIKVPVYTGGSTTPDFVYAVQQKDSTHLYILIETKSQDMRNAERIAVLAQQKLFQNLDKVNVKWHLAKTAIEVQNILRELEQKAGT